MNELLQILSEAEVGSSSPSVRPKKKANESFCPGLVEATKGDDFLNTIASGIGDVGLGYWFSAESEEAGMMVFEFVSTKAPKITLSINKEEFDKFFADGVD